MTDTQGFWFSKRHTTDCKTKPPKPTGKLNRLNSTSNKSTEFGRNSQSTAFIEYPLFTEKCNRSNRGSWKHKGTTLKTSVQCAVVHRGEYNKRWRLRFTYSLTSPNGECWQISLLWNPFLSGSKKSSEINVYWIQLQRMAQLLLKSPTKNGRKMGLHDREKEARSSCLLKQTHPSAIPNNSGLLLI